MYKVFKVKLALFETDDLNSFSLRVRSRVLLYFNFFIFYFLFWVRLYQTIFVTFLLPTFLNKF